MTITQDLLAESMTVQGYIDQIKVNKEPFVKIYESVAIPTEVQQAFDALESPLRIVTFTADWCGDAMSTTPAVLRLAESSANLSIDVFNRDDHLDIANTFLAENRAGTVPLFTVYDSDMNEIARFIETAHELVPDIDAMDDDINKEVEGMNDVDARRHRRGRRTSYRIERAERWGNVILKSFCNTVADGLASDASGRPAVGGTTWP